MTDTVAEMPTVVANQDLVLIDGRTYTGSQLRSAINVALGIVRDEIVDDIRDPFNDTKNYLRQSAQHAVGSKRLRELRDELKHLT